MGMLDALMVGAASGAGNGIAGAASEYGKFSELQALDDARANLEVEKARRIQENTIAATNADQANTGQIFNEAFRQAAGFEPGTLPPQVLPAAAATSSAPSAALTAAPNAGNTAGA
ncbi:MAG: hypothetical protein KGI47_10445, partial [Betaproteobacteria bacterium]|nr:hypothetical protein [Betaproteobacteria bacterium]